MDPLDPEFIVNMPIAYGNFDIQGSVFHCLIENTIYTNEGAVVKNQVYRTYDISDLDNPSINGEMLLWQFWYWMDDPDPPNHVSYQLVSSRNSIGLVYDPTSMQITAIYGVSNQPHIVASLQIDESLNSMILKDNIAFVALGSRLSIVDFENYLDADRSPNNSLPAIFRLNPPYPNPFNSSVTISYSVGQVTKPVRLAIYDLSGRMVADLLKPDLQASRATHSKIQTPNSKINKVVWDAGSVGAGVYFVRLEAGENSSVRKILLVR